MTMALEVENGAYTYPNGADVLSDVNFRFSGREVMCILGPNGAGKTTLLRAILGLAPFTRGVARWNGKPVADWQPKACWQRIGYVPQAKRMNFAAMTIGELVALGRSARLGPFSLPGRDDWAKVDRAMEEVGITHLRKRLASEVSGGQLQLALIARALAVEPELLVLDEPESNLDFRNQRIVLEVIERLAERGLGAILNTHFPAHAVELSESVLLVPRGKPPVCGRVADVMTESILTDVFEIGVRIRDLDLPERTVTTVTAVGRALDASGRAIRED